MLRKYISDLSYILKAPPVELREDLSFEVQPVGIVDQKNERIEEQSHSDGQSIMKK